MSNENEIDFRWKVPQDDLIWKLVKEYVLEKKISEIKNDMYMDKCIHVNVATGEQLNTNTPERLTANLQKIEDLKKLFS